MLSQLRLYLNCFCSYMSIYFWVLFIKYLYRTQWTQSIQYDFSSWHKVKFCINLIYVSLMFCFIFYGDINFETKISLSTWLFGIFMIYFIMILATHLVLSDKGLKPRLNYQFIRIWTITFVEYPFTMNSRGTIARD